MTPAEFAAIPTPETDAKTFQARQLADSHTECVTAQNAKSLERRLHVAREALMHYKNVVESVNDRNSFTPSIRDAGNYAREALRVIEEMK